MVAVDIAMSSQIYCHVILGSVHSQLLLRVVTETYMSLGEFSHPQVDIVVYVYHRSQLYVIHGTLATPYIIACPKNINNAFSGTVAGKPTVAVWVQVSVIFDIWAL